MNSFTGRSMDLIPHRQYLIEVESRVQSNKEYQGLYTVWEAATVVDSGIARGTFPRRHLAESAACNLATFRIDFSLGADGDGANLPLMRLGHLKPKALSVETVAVREDAKLRVMESDSRLD